ncbi:bifunctional aspartate kinase/homoserine dehydrogenase I [Steroidobacter denitrificans]|uniref:bifunctional aspartate kinase/homoserine dehydrogenase I n=1 Tax=Steroidobacter denitrificans TaxID=465721 RepID=UPI000AC41017|nr:bifunctional aspartate kinase/homoserine dehydrogenase I [Steroidobacter denitrificans]
MERWRVHKFGGSSVADAVCMERVARILEQDPHPRMGIVLSACRGVTDTLLGVVAAAERREDVTGRIEELRRRHETIADTLLPEEARQEFMSLLTQDCRDIASILHTISLIRFSSQMVRDLVAGYGEIWSTRLFSAYLRHRGRRPGQVQWVDAREVVVVEWGSLGPGVRWTESQENMDRLVPSGPATLIITGFIARDPKGLQTTLGRNGSDFSGSIFGALLNAEQIHIWTDVDGVLSADPRLVPEAKVIDSLSYSEAMELAYFGAKVIHPQTMAPAVRKGIPIWIRNSFAPEKPGTLICANPSSQLAVKGITCIDRVALVNLEGAGMIGVPGTAHRLFGALRDHGISVILISQGSSEHSICFAIPEAESVRAETVVRQAFERELQDGHIQSVEVEDNCSILAVVGDGMAGSHGAAAKVFGALGAAAVSVRAIAQGASERNISAVIDGKHSARALRSVHSSFYLSPHTISIGLIGPGLVGGVLLDQFASQVERLSRELKVDLRVRGIMGSSRMHLAGHEIPLGRWRDAFGAHQEPADMARFVQHVNADHLPHAIIIDCTSSLEVAQHYPAWLAGGIHVVTPNKKANSADLPFYLRLQEASRQGNTHYMYEATVGAGLPIVQTLRDLHGTGDRIQRIEGILSGTLSYLFNVWDGSQPFSQVLHTARAKGYTEPDPRDDLSGIDFARKIIILAREMGLRLEMQDVQLEGLVPEALTSCAPQEFLDRLPEFDAPIAERLRAAQARGRVLRYVGAIDAASSSASVGLVELERSHTFANINLTDNVVRFVTQRYNQNPLIVQGPGAGPDVTAGGVFADLLRVCAYLGAKL